MKHLLFLFLLLFAACTGNEHISDKKAIMQKTTQPDSLLRHVVLFSFNEDSYPDGVREVEDAFAALPAKIPEIYSYEWGTNNSPEGLDKNFSHLFFVTFKNEVDRDIYLPHPDHQAFVEILKPHLKDVLVVDYWTK